MRSFPVVLLVIFAFGMGLFAARQQPQAALATSINPSSGYTIHIDAQRHFVAHPTEIAHHWCKAVSGGMLECLIFNSDTADARLVMVETIVKPATYKAFPAQEQALWHYHATEIPKISATMPDVSPAVAKTTVASLMQTYGKLYQLWDPMTSKDPIGQPSVAILH